MSTHTLNVRSDGETASASCESCGYAFIAPVGDRGLDLSQRTWFGRGDRSTRHVYMASPAEMFAIAMKAKGVTG